MNWRCQYVPMPLLFEMPSSPLSGALRGNTVAAGSAPTGQPYNLLPAVLSVSLVPLQLDRLEAKQATSLAPCPAVFGGSQPIFLLHHGSPSLLLLLMSISNTAALHIIWWGFA